MKFSFPLPLVLDGATGTNLYAAGMPQGVCVEDWIIQHPEAIQTLQKEFAKAGSNCVYAPTFGANRAKLSHYGFADQTAQLNRQLFQLSREAVGQDVLVAGDLSPTGLMPLPFGETEFDELVDIYSEQVKALKEAGADLIILETQMTLAECRAGVLAAKEAGLPVFVTMTVNERGSTLMGCSLLSGLIILQGMGVSAFGANCSFGPEALLPVLETILPYAKIPVIAKPNAGVPDASGSGYDLTPEKMAECIGKLMEAGVRIVGGCCGTTPAHLAAIARRAKDFSGEWLPVPQEKAILANEREIFFVDDEIEVSEPILCQTDMSEELIDAEDSGCGLLRIRLESEGDGHLFSLNSHMARLPVLFSSDRTELLREALRYYNGLAALDSECSIPREELERIAADYGALIY
ncbi:MAG: homocysteine S-methyltransferase family protein [Ruminococcaceae bacterium]|nr:homocysteine S-methyltransferase family protein [Oscillospiraceae bacterium]